MASSDAAAKSQSALPRFLKQADGNLLHFAKVISTTSNLETFLLTLTYSLKFVQASLKRITAARLAAAASNLAENLSTEAPGALLPGEALVATIETAPSSRLLRSEQSITNFLKIIDEVRTFMRLKTLLSMWVWGSGSLKSPNPDPVLRSINAAQIISLSGFAVLENWAFLGSKGVLAVKPENIMPMYIWSARAWTAYILFEFARLWRTSQKQEVRSAAAGGVGEKAQKREDDAWWAAFYGNAVWAPLAVSWSLGPELSYAGDGMIATLGGAAGWMGMVRAWRATV